MRKEIRFLRENFIFYLAGMSIILGLKCYYRQADCDSLLWILAPTARWVEILSRIQFTYISGTGYVNHGLRMVIAPSCSGVRFMVILFATLVFSFVHIMASSCSSSGNGNARNRCQYLPEAAVLRAKALAGGLGWIGASVFLAWILTVFVNGLRIITAVYLPMYLEEAGLMGGFLTQDRLHTIIGAVVYFAALLTIYRAVGRMIRKRVKSPGLTEKKDVICKCAPPVFWYFVLTLGLPFISRVSGSSTAGFAEFAALVTGCCALVLLPYLATLLLRRLFP